MRPMMMCVLFVRMLQALFCATRTAAAFIRHAQVATQIVQ
jgi:hypothetical protein